MTKRDDQDTTGTDRVEDACRVEDVEHSAGSRGPWTPDEEEAISILMELMPLLAEANAEARRRRYRRIGSGAGGEEDSGMGGTDRDRNRGRDGSGDRPG